MPRSISAEALAIGSGFPHAADSDPGDVFEALGVDVRLLGAHTSLPYYRRTNPAMAGNARHVIRTVLEEF